MLVRHAIIGKIPLKRSARGEAESWMSSDKDMARSPWHSGMLVLWAVLIAVWMMANSTLSPVVAALGLVVTLCLARIFAGGAAWRQVRFSAGAAGNFLAYTGTFVVELVKANLNMVGHVYAPAIGIRPGIVGVRTRLKSPIGRLALANSIALTPGSLILDLKDDKLFVHWLEVQTTDADEASKIIASPFENHLEKVFG
jgi:multicomponent Na+:H+ antiporter subunit E